MIVADTNIVASLFVPTPSSTVCENVLSADPYWITPPLWRSELRNTFLKYIKAGHMTVSDAVRHFGTAERLLGNLTYDVDTPSVLDLASSTESSAYDCEFVSLAVNFKLQLVTLDKRVLKNFPDLAIHPKDFVT